MKRLVVLLALLSGCLHLPQQPPADYLLLSKSLTISEPAWRHEAEKRFHNPVLLICHGDTVRGQWWCVPDQPYRDMTVEAAVQTLCALYPTRPIVLICCNEHGYTLHAPRANVWYAKRLVCAVPLCLFHPEAATNIYDFVEAEH